MMLVEKGSALRRERLRLMFVLVVGTVIAMMVFAARVKIANTVDTAPEFDSCKRTRQCIIVEQCISGAPFPKPSDDNEELLKQYRSN